MRTPRLVPINMRKAKEHNHPDIVPGRKKYLCRIDGELFCGSFSREWYGLAFDGWYNDLQFDAPGTNGSEWKQIWEIKTRK